MEAFRRGLRDLGWSEGKLFDIEYRWANGNPDLLAGLVRELLDSKVDVLVVSGPGAITAARTATRTIPVVVVVLTDPVSAGFVQSMARPGGKMTGLASQYEELIAKQLQLLRETVPHVSRVGLLRHTKSSQAVLAAAESAGRALGLAMRTIRVTREEDLEGACRTAREERVGAMLVSPSPYLGAQRGRLTIPRAILLQADEIIR